MTGPVADSGNPLPALARDTAVLPTTTPSTAGGAMPQEGIEPSTAFRHLRVLSAATLPVLSTRAQIKVVICGHLAGPLETA